MQENDALALLLIQTGEDLLVDGNETRTIVQGHIGDEGFVDLDFTEVVTMFFAAHHLERARFEFEDGHRRESSE